jgi:hypothetical protein
MSSSEKASEGLGSSCIDRLAELLKRHPKLMLSKVRASGWDRPRFHLLLLMSMNMMRLTMMILSKDHHGMPLVVWAAKCKSRDAMAALLNAGAPTNTIYNSCRYRFLLLPQIID